MKKFSSSHHRRLRQVGCWLTGLLLAVAADADDKPGKLEDPATFVQRNIAAYQAELAKLKQKYEELGCGQLPKPPEAQKPPVPPPPGGGLIPGGPRGGGIPGGPGGWPGEGVSYKIELWRVVNQGGNNPFLPRDPVNNRDGILVLPGQSSSSSSGGSSSSSSSSSSNNRYQLGNDRSIEYDFINRLFGRDGQFYWYVDSGGNIQTGPIAPAGWGVRQGQPAGGTMAISVVPGSTVTVLISLDNSLTGNLYQLTFSVVNQQVTIISVTQP